MEIIEIHSNFLDVAYGWFLPLQADLGQSELFELWTFNLPPFLADSWGLKLSESFVVQLFEDLVLLVSH